MGIALQKAISVFDMFGVDWAIDYRFALETEGEKTIALFLKFGKSKNPLR